MIKYYELPLEELLEKLSQYDEISLLEMLGVDSEVLVYTFRDYIEDNYDRLVREVQ